MFLGTHHRRRSFPCSEPNRVFRAPAPARNHAPARARTFSSSSASAFGNEKCAKATAKWSGIWPPRGAASRGDTSTTSAVMPSRPTFTEGRSSSGLPAPAPHWAPGFELTHLARLEGDGHSIRRYDHLFLLALVSRPYLTVSTCPSTPASVVSTDALVMVKPGRSPTVQ
jgi:hypothetical protein